MTRRTLLASALALAVVTACSRSEPIYPIEQQIRFSFTARNRVGRPLRDTELRVFAPVKELASQKTLRIESSHPYRLLDDRLGNQVLSFQLTIPPWGTEVVSVGATVALAEKPNAESLDDPARYLRPSPFIESADSRIATLAQSLDGDGDLAVAASAYHWVGNHVKDAGYVREDRGALYALERGVGDCTEHMYLFAALARARGIPTRTVAGFVTDGSAFVRSQDYHNWAEFYADDTWHVADSQRGEFDPANHHYIAMRVIAPEEANPMGNSQRFLAFAPELEVRMD